MHIPVFGGLDISTLDVGNAVVPANSTGHFEYLAPEGYQLISFGWQGNYDCVVSAYITYHHTSPRGRFNALVVNSTSVEISPAFFVVLVKVGG